MNDPRWLDEPEERAWRGLMKMQEGLSLYVERQLRQHSGLSGADYQVLAHLSEQPEGRLRAFQLGEVLRWEKSRLSQHLTRMEKRGLVGREPCATDQRGAFVVITAQGRHSVEAAAPRHVEDVRRVLIDDLSPQQLELLADIGDQVQTRLAEVESE